MLRHACDQCDVGLFEEDPRVNPQSECKYGGYARERGDSKWTVEGRAARLAAPMRFARCSGGLSRASFFAVLEPKTGNILLSGEISPTLIIGEGSTPVLEAGTSLAFLP
jgi:hypothetical protein